jgi:hypothetical protein
LQAENSCMVIRMRKIIKNIPAFFLWIAWLVITAHLIIPHDHHSSDLYGNKEDECPVTDGKSGHNHGLPVHCHAFNDLVTEKVIKYIPGKHIQSHDFTLYDFNKISDFQTFHITIIEQHKTFASNPTVEFYALRAPPVVS